MNNSVVEEVSAHLLLFDALDVSKASCHITRRSKSVYFPAPQSLYRGQFLPTRRKQPEPWIYCRTGQRLNCTFQFLHQQSCIVWYLISLRLPCHWAWRSYRPLMVADCLMLLLVPVSMWYYNRCSGAFPDCLITALNDCSITCTFLLFLTPFVPRDLWRHFYSQRLRLSTSKPLDLP